MTDKTFLGEGDAASAAVAKGPRVSLADIEAAIGFEQWFTADLAKDRFLGVWRCDMPEAEAKSSLEVLTVCIIVLRNGFTVIGKSAPASRDNFDRELGRKLARDDAIRQIWPLMGFALRDRLHHVQTHPA